MPSAGKVPVKKDEVRQLRRALRALAPGLSALPTARDPGSHRREIRTTLYKPCYLQLFQRYTPDKGAVDHYL